MKKLILVLAILFTGIVSAQEEAASQFDLKFNKENLVQMAEDLNLTSEQKMSLMVHFAAKKENHKSKNKALRAKEVAESVAAVKKTLTKEQFANLEKILKKKHKKDCKKDCKKGEKKDCKKDCKKDEKKDCKLKKGK